MASGKKKTFTNSWHSGSFDDYELQPYDYNKMHLILNAINKNGQGNVPMSNINYYKKHQDRFLTELYERKNNAFYNK